MKEAEIVGGGLMGQLPPPPHFHMTRKILIKVGYFYQGSREKNLIILRNGFYLCKVSQQRCQTKDMSSSIVLYIGQKLLGTGRPIHFLGFP